MLQSAAATLRALSAAALIVIPLPPACRVQAPPVFGVCASSIVFAATVKLSWTKIVCAHGQLEDLAMREVIHGRIVEMESVGEPLIVVGDEREAVVTGVGAVDELLDARALSVVVDIHLQHAVELVRADRHFVGRVVDEL